MKKTAFIIAILVTFCSVPFLTAQEKYALVIGNGAYTGVSRLNNPVNDANDMEAALTGLGFTVKKVLDGSLDQMENAVMDLSRSLSADSGSYGFFYYAGHGVQAGGENYLLPVDSGNIQNEALLRQRAVSLRFVMDTLGAAGNELNMVVLDACRDNPFAWARGGSRGLTVISGAPGGSIIMYATGANATADDNRDGQNGLFTGRLLANLRTDGLSVYEMFERTMADVAIITGGRQHPELSIRYLAASSTYLGSRPDGAPVARPILPYPVPEQPAVEPQVTTLRAGGSKYLVNAGLGYGGDVSYGTGLSGSASFEYLFPNGPSVGAVLGMYTIESDFYSGGIFSINAKAAWNWNVNPRFIPSLGLLLGANFGYLEEVSSYYSFYETKETYDMTGFSVGLDYGIRFFFNDYIGLCFDGLVIVGTGDPWAFIMAANIGVAVKYYKFFY